MKKLPLGQVVATPGVIRAAEASGDSLFDYITRHEYGVWGDVDSEDWKANEDALAQGGRVLSVYHLRDKTKIYVITEADRSSTCVLLPDEY